MLIASPALAETETANIFDMLGWDATNKIVYLRDCQTENGPWDLWAIDFKEPAKPHIAVKPIEKKTDVPKGLELVKSVQLDEVALSGAIRKEQLERSGNNLVKRFDLRVVVEWQGARAVSDFISYRSPEMSLNDVFRLPETPCALAIVSWSAHLTGVQKQRALVMCPEERGAPLKPKK